jgi:hypothetical protein
MRGSPDMPTGRRPQKRVLLAISLGIAALVGGVVGWNRTDAETSRARAVPPDKQQASTAEGRALPRLAEPPRLRTSEGSGVELRPGQPGYDPTRFLGPMLPRDIYSQEPRNDAWATAVETRIAARAATELTAILSREVAEPRIACKTTTCLIKWRIDQDQEGAIAHALRILYPGAAFERGPADADSRSLYVIYAGGSLSDVPYGDVDALFAKVTRIRGSLLRFAKRMPEKFPGVPVDKLPSE